MSRFQQNIQPSIVKLSYEPESYLDGKYYINYNCVNIECLSSYTYLGDFPRIYFNITDGVVKDDSCLERFIRDCAYDAETIIFGNGELALNRDYFVNDTLATYFGIVPASYPNYLDENGEISSYFNMNQHYDYSNLKYYNRQNRFVNYEFTEEEIRNLYSTFAYVILEGTTIDEESLLTVNNQIYTRVLNWLKKFQHDEASIALELILGTQYSIATSTSSKSNCGCAATNRNVIDATQPTSCYEIYTSAMKEYVKSMLGNYEFYVDWMLQETEEGVYIPNYAVIDSLIKLLEEFLEYDFDLSFTKKKYFCGCSDRDKSMDKVNKDIIRNYIKVLNWIREQNILCNANKIKIYGEEFGNLLPKLQF